MPRYAAFLRGVMPMNAKMSELKQAFESAGFRDVVTVRSSGNVVFSAARGSEQALQRKAEASMEQQLGRAFLTIVRRTDALQELLASDPYHSFRLDPVAKRIVTFLRHPPSAKLELPIELDGARILVLKGRDILSAYMRSDKGPVFMTLLEKTLGKEQTTRTWDTVAKVAGA
jgi:uncharacterized protein (DUF1697 family)